MYSNLLQPISNTLTNFENFESQELELIDYFLFLRKSTVTSFFISNMVDMPLCFQKSKSLFTRTFEIPMLKLINMIMRHGLKNQALKWTTLTFTKCFHSTLGTLNTLNFFKWQVLYKCLMLTSINITSSLSSSFQNDLETMMESHHKITTEGCLYNNLIFLKNILFDKLSKYSSIFSFYIRRVDKNIRKNSRNKSGKYTVVWKYVPVFKRLFVTLRWFLKDLKFQKCKTLFERFTKLLLEFLLTPRLSFIHSLKRFNNKFVFNSYRTSLLKSLKSIG